MNFAFLYGVSLFYLSFFIQRIISQEDSCVYLSTSGNDTTGNGSLQKPYKTIDFAMNRSIQMGEIKIELCFVGDNYTNATAEVDTAKIFEVSFNGTGVGFLDLIKILPKPSGMSVGNFTMSFYKVKLSNLEIQNGSNVIFNTVIFNSVHIGETSNSPNWFVTAQNILMINCDAISITTGSIWFNTSVNGLVQITSLTWMYVTNIDIGFNITTDNLLLTYSTFTNSTSVNSIVSVSNSSNNLLQVYIRNITFNYNLISDDDFFSIIDSSNISVINSTFNCNTDFTTGLILPFFSTLSTSISLSHNLISSQCPIQCPLTTLALNSLVLFPCVACGIGNGSFNYICQPCGPDTYSTSGVCNTCPIYSSQPLSGQSNCYCFSKSYVSDVNEERCNNEVWGIIIALVYVVVIGGIVWFRRPKKKYEPLV